MNQPALEELLQKRFVFVTGKGGVGKTTFSAALALWLSGKGKRVLLCECNAFCSPMSTLLGIQEVPHAIETVLPRLDVVNIVPRLALKEYGKIVLKLEALYEALFENVLVEGLLSGTPGIESWAMLGKAYHHAKEKDFWGQHTYDVVIVDAPATGHGIEMLKLPQTIANISPKGLLKKEAEKAFEMISDARETTLVTVTTLEEMPMTETLTLLDRITQELSLPFPLVVMNNLMKPIASSPPSETLSDEQKQVWLYRQQKERVQQREKERLLACMKAKKQAPERCMQMETLQVDPILKTDLMAWIRSWN